MAEVRGFAYSCEAQKPTGPDCDPQVSSQQQLSGVMEQATKSVALAGLASEKNKDVICALDRIKNFGDMRRVSDDTARKVDMLCELYEERIKFGNEALLLSRSKKPEDKVKLNELREKYKEVPAKILMIENTIPYSKTGPMGELLQKYLGRFHDPNYHHIPVDKDEFAKNYAEAVRKLESDLNKDKVYLDQAEKTGGESLDRNAREALIQDAELVEKFKATSRATGRSVDQAMCDLNNTYGDGAKARDNAILYGSIISTGASFGTGAAAQGLARSGIALSTATITKTLRGAMYIGRAGAVFDLVAGIKGVSDSCGNHQQLNKADCSEFAIEAIEQNNCKLAAAIEGAGLALTGAAATAQIARKAGHEIAHIDNPQVQLWLRMERGDPEAAVTEKKLYASLEHSGFKEVKEIGDSGTKSKKFVTLEDGTRAIWKPKTIAAFEVAAHKVDRALGLNLVPITVDRSYKRRQGSLQLIINDLDGHAQYGNLPDDIHLLDLLLDNSDRNKTNWLVTNKGRAVAIDHDVRTFSEVGRPFKSWAENIGRIEKQIDLKREQIRGATSPNLIARLESEILSAQQERNKFLQYQGKAARAIENSPEIIRRLTEISPEKWREILKDDLQTKHIDAFLLRREEILEHAKKLKETGDF